MSDEADIDALRAKAHAHDERTVKAWAGRLVAGQFESQILGEAFVRDVNCTVEKHQRLITVKLVFSLSGERQDVDAVADFINREIGAIRRINAIFGRQNRP